MSFYSTHESQKIECGCKPITERTVEEVHSLGETTVNGWAVLCLDRYRFEFCHAHQLLLLIIS